MKKEDQSKIKNEELVEKVCKLVRQFEEYIKPRFEEISQNEQLAMNQNIDVVAEHRFNLNLPILSGFVDTLVSRIKGKLDIQFAPQDDADIGKAKKITAAWKKDSGPDKGAWVVKDILAKRQAALCGRAIYLIYAESDPKYKSVFEVVNYKDFICQPAGGWDLQKHLFCGRKNIRKTFAEAKAGIKSGRYLSGCLDAFSSEEMEDITSENTRDTSFGELQPDNYKFVGVQTINLHEIYLTTNEGRKKILIHIPTKTLFSISNLSDDFPNGEYPIYSWATHPDLDNFWSKAPADDVRLINVAMNKIFNQALDGIEKRNFPQKLVDQGMVKDPNLLNFIPNGVIPVDAMGQDVRRALAQLETPDNAAITINLIQFLDAFTGIKTGITPGSQGQAQEGQVGIYFGNMEQVAKRLGPTSEYYKLCYVQLAKAYLQGLKEHMGEKMLVKMIGAEGLGWDKLTKEDLETNQELDYVITGNEDEEEVSEMIQRRKIESLAILTNNPNFSALLNPEEVITQVLRSGKFTNDEVERLLDLKGELTEEATIMAADAFEKIILGKTPQKYYNATISYVKKLQKLAIEKDLGQEKFKALQKYIESIMPIVAANEFKKAQEMAREMMIQAMTAPIEAEGGEADMGTPNGLSVNSAPGVSSFNVPNPNFDGQNTQQIGQAPAAQVNQPLM
jgi:arsenate reductase-like glutaredoxin family protein